MKIAFFSAHAYDIDSLKEVAEEVGATPQHELVYVCIHHTGIQLT